MKNLLNTLSCKSLSEMFSILIGCHCLCCTVLMCFIHSLFDFSLSDPDSKVPRCSITAEAIRDMLFVQCTMQEPVLVAEIVYQRLWKEQ